ncbi:MAG: hypothetical protein J6U70_02220 [Bacteroidales bacterium]|jgi:hypothetical protein|nr:hypothetical protein [Bacteroidales bacterium]
MNLRVFKKDVDYLVEEIISDALLGLNFAQGNEKEDVIYNVISEAIALREAIYIKINHYDRENARAYFNGVHTEFLKALDSLFEKLSETAR